ncbi:ribonuclease HII/HIII, partial [mine drainage metagenome]
GSNLKSAGFSLFSETGSRTSQLKCTSCKEFIIDAGTTLRYYCGYVLPDSSVIQRNLITRDLEVSKFFANYTVILHKVVRKECDGTPKGISEFEGLERFYNMGRIKLIGQGRISEIQEGLSNTVRDELIMDGCIENNAILLSADKSMTAFAVSKGIFTIFI